MTRLPDLVRDTEYYETRFPPGQPSETIHRIREGTSRRFPVVRVERWSRLKVIASGGGGAVFLEERLEPKTRNSEKPILRAVKRIALRQNTRPEDFAPELEAIAKFSQNKYRKYGCFVYSDGWYRTPEYLFIAMEYLELGDLSAYLYRDGQLPLSEREVQEIVYQILVGLQEMHDSDLYHRDMKLKNILIHSCPPDQWRIKLTDFGLSKRVEEGFGTTTALEGTPGYMAPEILGYTSKGSEYARDIWAVGEITFQLLTKRPAFRLPAMMEGYKKDYRSFPTEPLHEVGVSNTAINFITALMAFEPDGRLTAAKAQQHAWIQQTLPTIVQKARRPYVSPFIAEEDEVQTRTGDYRSWSDTLESTVTPIAIRKPEDTSSTTGNKTYIPPYVSMNPVDEIEPYPTTSTKQQAPNSERKKYTFEPRPETFRRRDRTENFNFTASRRPHPGGKPRREPDARGLALGPELEPGFSSSPNDHLKSANQHQQDVPAPPPFLDHSTNRSPPYPPPLPAAFQFSPILPPPPTTYQTPILPPIAKNLEYANRTSDRTGLYTTEVMGTPLKPSAGNTNGYYTNLLHERSPSSSESWQQRVASLAAIRQTGSQLPHKQA